MNNLLCRGNAKLGHDLIFSFGLPSGGEACPGRTATCHAVCYGRRLEGFRGSLLARYQRNLAATRRKDFVARVVEEIRRRWVRVLRWQVGGDVYSAGYARKLRLIAEATPFTQHFLYTRSYRIPAIRKELERLATRKNVRLWWSLDRDTGLPAGPIPPRVRLCYLQVDEPDLPPEGTGLVFRVRRLRRSPNVKVEGVPVCPVETPRGKQKGVSCSTCGLCFKRLPGDREGEWKTGRFALGVVPW